MQKIYFVRHLKTKHNKENNWCGRTDLSIDKKLAKEYITSDDFKEIKNLKFDEVYISPLKRCKETYDLYKFNNRPNISSLLIERDFGSLEGKKCIKEIKDALCNIDADLQYDNVEKLSKVYQRLLLFLDLIPKNKDILIISHSWIGRLLKYHFSKNKNDIQEAPTNGKLYTFFREI